MNKSIFIIAIVIASILAGGFLLINRNPRIKSMAEKYGIINTPVKSIPASYNAVFCIFDPSGSGKSTYNVPIISVDFIRQIITKIEEKGYGELWLTFIDRSALNNKLLHFNIPIKMNTLEPPVRKVGQRKGEYDKELADFEKKSVKEALKTSAELQSYNEAKEKFLKECSEMINKGYAPKKSYEDYSDVIGSLNAAVRSLATLYSDSVHFRSILLISDGVQDVAAGDAKQQLNEISDDIMLITVNYGGSLNSVVAGKSTEVDNLDRGLEKIIRVYKPKNQ
jgi:hypothetical protein